MNLKYYSISVIDNTGFILETDILPLCNTKHFS